MSKLEDWLRVLKEVKKNPGFLGGDEISSDLDRILRWYIKRHGIFDITEYVWTSQRYIPAGEAKCMLP